MVVFVQFEHEPKSERRIVKLQHRATEERRRRG